MKKINIIGAGLIGQDRMRSIMKLKARGMDICIGSVFDPWQPKLTDLEKIYGFRTVSTIEALIDDAVDLVVIATPHDVAVGHAINSLKAGHNVLLEKPMGRTLREAQSLRDAESKCGRLFIGMNYRFMPGVEAIIRDWNRGLFGQPISLRLEIGHGGRPGDAHSWKLDPVHCGGGAVLDPGVHLIDLTARMLGNDLQINHVDYWTGFWNTGIEERVSLGIKAPIICAQLEISVVRWRSHFEILAQGTDGYGRVLGRGRSYGRQTYVTGKRWGWQSGQSQAESECSQVDDECDSSLADELAAILYHDRPHATAPASSGDALLTMQLVESIYKNIPTLSAIRANF